MGRTRHSIPDQKHNLHQASAGQGQLYALIDGAIAPDLEANILAHRTPLDHMPLLLGDALASFAPISPRLIRLTLDDDLLWWLLDEGQAASWGIYLCSNADMSTLYHHLYSLTAVRNLDGESVQFRYYDPRVLRPFWQVLNPEERHAFMGPITCMIVEDEQKPGFWAYQGPKDLEPPPFPPTPKDWTSLPEPWWQITAIQHQALTEYVLQRFLRRFADYLVKKRDELRPDLKIDFHSEEYQQDLTQKAHYFMQHGFDTEKQLAEVLKYVQVFSLNLRNEPVRKIVENHSIAISERLDAMHQMAMQGNRHS